MTLRIFGAGMAGLLAANMLRRHSPVIHEAQPSMPDNHGALLRFRSKEVARATGIRLDKVNVKKAVMCKGELRDSATIADANRYSIKVAGEAMERSVLSLTGGERFIAPPDFIRQLNAGCGEGSVRYNSPLTNEFVSGLGPGNDPIISTIPMPILMTMVDWPQPEFRWRPVWSVRGEVLSPPTRLYQTIYYPEFEPYYRASITGNQFIVEYMQDPGATFSDDMHKVAVDFGFKPRSSNFTIAIGNPKRQEYGKLLPIADGERRAFILAMSDQYNIYSLGRFATWRQILMDDVVKDVEVIEGFINERSTYGRRLHG
jgi:hypothetical protein